MTITTCAVQDAPVGGESIIARNRDLNKSLPPEVTNFIKDHGGIEYSREFYDAHYPPLVLPGSPPPTATGSWQEKCGLPNDADRAEAESFFLQMGFKPSQIEWKADGGLRVSNWHSGFVKDPDTGEDVWCETLSGRAKHQPYPPRPTPWLRILLGVGGILCTRAPSVRRTGHPCQRSSWPRCNARAGITHMRSSLHPETGSCLTTCEYNTAGYLSSTTKGSVVACLQCIQHRSALQILENALEQEGNWNITLALDKYKQNTKVKDDFLTKMRQFWFM